MKKLSIFILLLAASLASADTLKSQIETMNRKMSAIMMKKDLKAFVQTVKSGVTKDFKYSENGHNMTFDEMVQGMKGGFDSMRKITMANSKLLSLKEKGNTATARTQHVMMGISMDEHKKEHKLVFTGESIETYRKMGGKWLMSSMSWKNQKMTLDGKPFMPR